MADLFYGCIINIATARTMVANTDFKLFKFYLAKSQPNPSGDAGYYIIPYAVFENGSGVRTSQLINDSYLETNIYTCPADTATKLTFPHVILNKTEFETLCPPNVESTAITVLAVGNAADTYVINYYYIVYEASTVLPGGQRGSVTLDPSPPHHS